MCLDATTEVLFPVLAIQTFDCQIGEHINKLVKIEFAPLVGQLRFKKLENTFFNIMRDWQVRALHFPGTIHVRRLEQYGSCKGY